MALAKSDVVPYLLHRKLISARSVVEGDLTILDASRRNRNFAIVIKSGQSYLLKQGTDAFRNASLVHEARVYELFQSDSNDNNIVGYIPRYFGYDPNEHVLIVEFLPEAEDLRDHHRRCGRFSTKIASAIGDALSLLHSKNWRNGVATAHVSRRQPPWILSMHRPDISILREISEANVQVIKIVQQYPEFCDRLDELRKDWTAEEFIHFDFKWENCLASNVPGDIKFKIIDWELAGPGDPLWDVGSVFSAYLNFWLLFVPVTMETQPTQSLQLARYPLERIQPAIRAFWKSYARGMQLDLAAAECLLVRAVKYGAARLVQTSYEQMLTSPQLVGNVVCSLQLSLNILKRPQDAVRDLMGITPLSN